MYICNYFGFYNKNSNKMQSTQLDYFPILMQFLLAVGFVVGMIILSGNLGPKRNSVNKDKNFECGIESVGNARIPFSVKYFLVAILFVLFDVEVIFLYPWAINFKEMGIEGMLKMVVFMLLLLVGFFYIIKKKALEWE
jgi:NADH-quinone oxidoreductase subunit A